MRHLLDAKPSEGLLLDVEKWFQDHRKERKVKAETVFQASRGQVLFVPGKGKYLGRHIQSNVDELVISIKAAEKCILMVSGFRTRLANF